MSVNEYTTKAFHYALLVMVIFSLKAGEELSVFCLDLSMCVCLNELYVYVCLKCKRIGVV